MIKKLNLEEKYPMLKEEFEKWFIPLYNEVRNEFNCDLYPSDVLTAKELSQDEYYKKYLKPFSDIENEEHLKLVLQSLSKHLKEKSSSPHYSYNISLRPRIGARMNALQWLLAQIADLNYFNLPDELKQFYKKPFKQCIYCGKPNVYVMDGEEKHFTLQTKCCHADGCDIGAPNLSIHKDNCHYKLWTQTKKNLNQHFRRIKAINIGKSTNEKLVEIFLEFCEDQYKKNLKIEYTIQYNAINFLNNKYEIFQQAFHFSELLF